jgi:uncharacterized protein (TIGR02271 family)
MATTEHILNWRGQALTDAGGSKIGTIEEIYLDADTGQPEWALVHTGMFGTKRNFVPLREAKESEQGVTAPYTKDQVKDAPAIDPDGQLSQREEAELYRHYGLEYSEQRSDSGLPEGGAGVSPTTGGAGDMSVSDRGDAPGTTGRDVSGPTTDDAMTRSEEELHVGVEQRESGRARLRKYIVEDEVTQTVPVRREEVRVEREPITDANVGDATDGPAISEEEHEVVLHEEQPVSEKRVVPKERVRLDKDVQTTEEQVSDTVRQERIDVEDDARG